MKKRLLAFIVSLAVMLGIAPGLPVFAGNDMITIVWRLSIGGDLCDPDNGNVYLESGSHAYASCPTGVEGSLTATPRSGYYFVGWSTSSSASNVFSTNPTFTATFDETNDGDEYWALFAPIVTVHFGTIENPDVIDPVAFNVTKTTTFEDLEDTDEYTAAIVNLAGELNTDGIWLFDDFTYRSLKDIGSWIDFEEADRVDVDNTFSAPKDIYVTALIPITSVEFSIASPLCGDTDETLPEITVADDAHYYVGIADDIPMARWFDPDADDDNEPETITFKGGETYYAKFDLEADFGYYFELAEDGSGIKVSNGKFYSYDEGLMDDYCWIAVSVIAEHDWGEWKTIKEPTTTEEGTARRECSACEAFEEKTLDKLTATEGSDDSSYVYVIEANGTQRRFSLDSNSWEYYDESSKTWKKLETPTFRFKSTGDDTKTISEFTGASITNNATKKVVTLSISGATGTGGVLILDDGTKVADFAAGSVIITLYDSYLKTLEPGEYTLTAYFKGGKTASTTFSVAAADAAAKAGTAVPATGEDVSYTMFLGGALVCVSVLGVALFLDKKRLGKKDVK